MTTPIFLHGLDSSGQGTKGSYLADRFPHILCPDFNGSLSERLAQLDTICQERRELVLIGSSFGGLMATCYAAVNREKVLGLVLLAPALNFEEYAPPQTKLAIPTLLVMGQGDNVCPPELVGPLAERTFSQLRVLVADDDHMLHKTFRQLDWEAIVTGRLFFWDKA